MMMFKEKKRKSFWSQLRTLKNYVAYSATIFAVGYLLNAGIHYILNWEKGVSFMIPGWIPVIGIVGIIFIFIQLTKRDF